VGESGDGAERRPVRLGAKVFQVLPQPLEPGGNAGSHRLLDALSVALELIHHDARG
jgi:hypothetical protein